MTHNHWFKQIRVPCQRYGDELVVPINIYKKKVSISIEKYTWGINSYNIIRVLEKL